MSQRVVAALAVALAVVPLLPFLDKAFSVDAPVFLAVARQILAAPLDPFGFDMFWEETSLATAEFNRNPPLFSYWLAPWLGIFGEREWVLHAAVLPFPALAALAFLGIARRVCGAGLAPVALLVSAPAFLVLATSLLLDVPLLACMLLAVYALLRGAQPGSEGWLWGAGAAAAAAGLVKYAGFSTAPLLAAGALLLCPRRGAALLRVILPPLVAWGAWGAWTAHQYGAVHFLGSSDVVTQRSFAPSVFGNQATALFVWYGGALVFPVLLWGRTLLRAGKGLEVALAALGVATAGVLLLLAEGQPARRLPIGLPQTVFAVACGAGGLHLWLSLARGGSWRRDPTDAFLALWLAGFTVFSLFVNWHVNAADALLAAPPALLLLFRRAELRPGDGWVRACVLLALALSLGLAVADSVQANFYRSVAREIAKQAGEAPGARWFVGSWGLQYYLEREGFRPVLPVALGGSTLAVGDWLAAPRNLPQQDIVPYERRTEVVEAARFERAGSWPLRTTNLDALAGFYSHRFGYTPFAWSREPFERVQLGRVTRVREEPAAAP